MKTKYLLLEFTEPVEINTTVPFNICADPIGNGNVTGWANGESFTVEWVHLFDEHTTAAQRMKDFLDLEEATGGVETL
jgi:hypothetical protein